MAEDAGRLPSLRGPQEPDGAKESMTSSRKDSMKSSRKESTKSSSVFAKASSFLPSTRSTSTKSMTGEATAPAVPGKSMTASGMAASNKSMTASGKSMTASGKSMGASGKSFASDIETPLLSESDRDYQNPTMSQTEHPFQSSTNPFRSSTQNPFKSSTMPAEARDVAGGDGGDGGAAKEVTVDDAALAMKKKLLDSIPITHAQLPLFIVFVASVILLVATGTFYRWGDYSLYAKYLLSVSCVPLVLSFLALVLTKFKEELYEKHSRWINLFCFLWSFVGACFITIKGPFTITGNGYFAAWAMVYGSAMTIGVTIAALGAGTRGVAPLLGAVVSSLVLIVETIAPIRDHGPQEGESIFALVMACVTVVFGVAVVAANRRGFGKRVNRPANYFCALATLTVWWVIMAFLVTFRGPFLATGNGYFGAWTGAMLMALAAFVARQDIKG